MGNRYVPHIVGIGGTSRAFSTSERAVMIALHEAEALGARTTLFNGEFVSRLPLYVPERTARTAEELQFVDAVRSCQGIIVATPGYHGALSGPIKNALDLLEETARDERPYLDGCGFGCIVTAYGWQACGTTLVSMRLVAHALRAWPTPFGATLNASTKLFADDGNCIDGNIRRQIATVAGQVVDLARWRAAGLTELAAW